MFAQAITERLVRDGDRVDVITGRWDRYVPKFEVINGVNVYRVRIPNLKYINVLLGLPRMIAKSRELDKVHGYDVIHSHIFPAMVCGAMTKKNKKLLITLQGGDLGEYKESNLMIRALE